jgi:hypothetical protein
LLGEAVERMVGHDDWHLFEVQETWRVLIAES